MGTLARVIEFAKHVLKAEYLTPPGVINLVGLFGGLVVLLGASVSGVWQAIARTWDANYSAGGDSLVVLLILYFLAMLACVIIVGLLSDAKNE